MSSSKRILAAVDFSKGSLRALQYAIALANKMEAGVLMCWVLKPDNNEGLSNNTMENLVIEARTKFDELIEKHQKDLKNGKLEYKIRDGKVHVEVTNQAKYSDVSLIVLGTHGVSGYEEHFIGSNARRIVTSAPCPVLTIRKDYCHTKKIERIVLPIDTTNRSRQKVPFTTEIAKTFNAEIHVVGTASANAEKKVVNKYTDQALKYISDRKVKTVLHNTSKKASDLIAYAQNVDANIISIMTEQEPSTLSILLGAAAEQVVTHSPIPVLSIHPKELYSITARL